MGVKFGIGECVIEHVEYVPTTPKLSWVRYIFLPLGALKIWGKPPLIKTPSLRNPLSKSIQMLTVNAPEMGYKFCKFCENRARDTPCGVFIFHILVKSEYKFQFLGSYTLVVEPMGVKFGMEEGTSNSASE